jgi:hypothetical protein
VAKKCRGDLEDSKVEYLLQLFVDVLFSCIVDVMFVSNIMYNWVVFEL